MITWLEKPENAVTLQVKMQSLPDGLQLSGQHHAEYPVERQLEVRITKSNYQKIAQ